MTSSDVRSAGTGFEHPDQRVRWFLNAARHSVTNRAAIVTAWCILFACCGDALSTVIYVDDDAPPGGDGTSWAAAYQGFQPAFAVATSGDQVWVAAGNYPFPGQPLNLPNGIFVYGGFTGNETSLEQRDWTVNEAKLVGGDNGLRFLDALNLPDGAVLDGLTFAGGGQDRDDRNSCNCGYSDSGAIRILNSPLSIDHCRFIDNCAFQRGGAIGIQNNLSKYLVTVDNSLFSGNYVSGDGCICACMCPHGGSGGAIYARGGGLAITGSRFVHSRAAAPGGSGGAVLAYEMDLTLVNCIFLNNRAAPGVDDRLCSIISPGIAGAVLHLAGATASKFKAFGCVFARNGPGFNGSCAALAITSEGPLIENCTVVHNDFGVATCITGGDGISRIHNSIFWHNNAPGVSGIDDQDDVAFNDFESIPAGLEAMNFSQAPAFVDRNNNDYRLAAGSFGIDASLLTTPYPFEIDTDPTGVSRRVDDPFTPNGTDILDLGAYETLLGDADENAEVDLDDFAARDGCVTGPDSGPWTPQCRPFDFDGDGDVDLVDYAGFVLAFSESGESQPNP